MPEYKIKYTHNFFICLTKIYNYIYYVLENPNSAKLITSEITNKCSSLATFPKVSPAKFTIDEKEIYFTHVKNYTIIYDIDDISKIVTIRAVEYSRRNILDIL